MTGNTEEWLKESRLPLFIGGQCPTPWGFELIVNL